MDALNLSYKSLLAGGLAAGCILLSVLGFLLINRKQILTKRVKGSFKKLEESESKPINPRYSRVTLLSHLFLVLIFLFLPVVTLIDENRNAVVFILIAVLFFIGSISYSLKKGDLDWDQKNESK